jgi:hypothetical protein
MLPMACMGAKAKLHVPKASPCAHDMRSHQVILNQSKAGFEAQPWHNVHTASTCAYNM